MFTLHDMRNVAREAYGQLGVTIVDQWDVFNRVYYEEPFGRFRSSSLTASLSGKGSPTAPAVATVLVISR